MNLYEMCRDKRGHFPIITPLPWPTRQLVFRFEISTGNIYLRLLDRVQLKCRVVAVSKMKKGVVAGEVAPYDVLIAYGGVDHHYERIIKKYTPRHHILDGGGVRAVTWQDDRLTVLSDDSPVANIHVCDPDLDWSPGQHIDLDGCTAAVTFDDARFPTANSLIAGRAWRGVCCPTFWPGHINIKDACDEIALISEPDARAMLMAINPRMYHAEEWRADAGLLRLSQQASTTHLSGLQQLALARR